MQSLHLRPITALDADAVIALGRQAHAASQYAHTPYSDDRIKGHLVNAIKHPHYYNIILLHTDDGEIVGGAMNIITTAWFTEQTDGDNVVMYVSPPYRSLIAIRMLVAAGEQWFTDNGVHRVRMDINSQADPRRIAKLYKRLGYKPVGIMMQKETK